MNKTRPRNWPTIFFYLLICIVSLGFLYVVAEWFFPKTSSELIPNKDALSARFMSISKWATDSQEAHKKTQAGPIKEKMMLLLNQEKIIGKSKLIYRGLGKKNAFKIDVVILELDPNAFYRYRIQIDDAEKGFRLAGQDFKLISARKSAAQVWHFK